MKKIIFISLGILICSAAVYNLYPEKMLPKDAVIDSIVVHKSQRQLEVFSKGQILKVYKVALGKNPVGAKEYEGDKKTPEGCYHIFDKNPESRFYKNLGISYPNEADIIRCNASGKPTGGDVKIHGLQNGLGIIGKLHRLRDWTAGCIALTDAEVDELYSHTPIGTPINILP